MGKVAMSSACQKHNSQKVELEDSLTSEGNRTWQGCCTGRNSRYPLLVQNIQVRAQRLEMPHILLLLCSMYPPIPSPCLPAPWCLLTCSRCPESVPFTQVQTFVLSYQDLCFHLLKPHWAMRLQPPFPPHPTGSLML